VTPFTPFLSILETVNNSYGALAPQAQPFCEAFTAAAQGEAPSDATYEHLLIHRRWLALLFQQSTFATMDHLAEGKDQREALLYMTNVDWHFAWAKAPVLTTHAALARLMPRQCLGQAEWDEKNFLLNWLPKALDTLSFDERVPSTPNPQGECPPGRVSEGRVPFISPTFLANSPEVYMHCSYAKAKGKHTIKRHIHRAMADAAGPLPLPVPAGRRALVICENLSPDHATWRTHSRALQALRAEFETSLLLYPPHKGAPAEALFDHTLAPAWGNTFIEQVRNTALKVLSQGFQVVLFLGVGMSAHVIALASLRLAPCQVASFGHTASTQSPVMDHFILPAAYTTSPSAGRVSEGQACFSERLLALPWSAMPMTPGPVPPRSAPEGRGGIAVPASIMKLNPWFLDTVGKIASATGEVIHFFPLAARGILKEALSREVHKHVVNACVWPELPTGEYLAKLASCRFFLCPFPYGNMNSLVEALRLGLPGVCLDGPEAHSHADAALFRAAGLSPRLVAQTADEYIRAAVALARDSDFALANADLGEKRLARAFFEGEPWRFAEALAKVAKA
jgi:hypothetical protein